MDLSRFQRLRRGALAALLVAAFLALAVVGSAHGEEMHEFIERAGFALMIVGIAGRIWCTFYIGGRKSAEIVDDGPYSMTRNPLYVFSTIAAAGVGAQTGSVLLGAVFAVGCALAFQPVIRREERHLIQLFGARYEDYLARVPRFLPRFCGYRDRAEMTIRTDRVYRTLTDGLVFLAAIPLFEGIELLQTGGYLPIRLMLP
jgi:protein-S-isoprenylcysteine O-methyltransferase Ste14